jgi:predicted TIM-barrel fold metal-dependent hydrolase
MPTASREEFAANEKYLIIDSDSHVVETERTWQFMDPEDEKYRPVLAPHPTDPRTQWWIINGQARGFRFPTLTEEEMAERSRQLGRDVVTPIGAREGDDVERRLRHMDRLGIDVQVMFHTLWTVPPTDRAEVELALCRSWNRWVAEMWRQGKGRLRWCAMLPLMSMDESLALLEWAKKNGAVGVSMSPIIGDRLPIDPYFHPLYDEAQRLDMAIAIHIGNGNAALVELTQPPYDRDSFGLMRFRLFTAGACEGLIESQLPLKFPRLRWAFIEAGSMWLPWMLHEARRRMEQRGRPLPDDVLREFNIFVTCQNNDDLSYTYRCGPDNIVIGSDYGHYDGSSQMDATLIMRRRTDIDEETKRKILYDNAKRLWGL